MAMLSLTAAKPRARLLDKLPAADRAALMQRWEAIELPLHFRIQTPNRRIEYVYFLDAGMASVVAKNRGREAAEVGIIGREGMTGLAIALHVDRSPHETFMQISGRGHRLDATTFTELMTEYPALRNLCQIYAYGFMVQSTFTTLANARNKLEERLARWLLMAHDRVDGDELELTHELLSLMLGVRRAGVTTALNILQADGLISHRRKAISIVDRDGLIALSNRSYGESEAELERLLSKGP